VETIESKRRPGTIPDEPFEAGAVGGLDADAPIQTEPTPVIPVEHVLGLEGFQEAVAGKVAEHSPSDRVLETVQELAGEVSGFVEAEAGFRIG
jgi:hypothetical protein